MFHSIKNKPNHLYDSSLISVEVKEVPQIVHDSHIVYDPHEGGERMNDIYSEIQRENEDSVSMLEII